MFKWILVICIAFLQLESLYAQEPGPFFIKDSAPLLAHLEQAGNDTNRVQLLLRLSNQYLKRHNKKPTDIDSSLHYAKSAEQLSEKLRNFKGLANSYLLLAWIYPILEQFEKGKFYAIQAVKTSAKYQYQSLLGESCFTLAFYYPLSEKGLRERVRLVNLSLVSFRRANSKIKEGDVLKELGDLYMLQGDYAQALPTLKNSMKVYLSVNHDRLMGVYDLLGRVYVQLGDPHLGLKYGLMALQNAKMVQDTGIALCTFHNRVGLTYRDLKDYKKAYYYFKISLKIAIKFKHAESIHEVAANTASTLNRLNRPQEALFLLQKTLQEYPIVRNRELLDVAPVFIVSLKKLEKYKQAKQYCDELLKIIAGSEPDDEVLSKIYATIIPFYLDGGDSRSASKYIPLHKRLAFETHNKLNESENLLWQSRLDSSRGNYLAAMKKYQYYVALKDSLINAAKLKQLNQIEIIYDIERKDENIGILTKQSELQNGLLKQASLVQNITFFSMLLLFGVIGLLYHSFITSKRNSTALQSKQNEINGKNISLGRLLSEKEWLIKEIHHRVKNNLHMIVGLLESQSEFLKGDEARTAISESQHRIQSMSMIHQKLYQSENLSSIDISAYIYEMVQYLKDSFNIRHSITFELKIERIEMNISHLVPLGLILNEAITNSIKYAFPDKQQGIISITLNQLEPENFDLVISDNGVGIKNEDLGTNKINSFGLTLIKGLCDDIDGHLEILNNIGTTIHINFLYHARDERSEPILHVSQ